MVPSVFNPVICRDSLKILRILKMRKIWAAFAMYSREYWDESWFRARETKKGSIPRRSIMLRKESMKAICLNV